MNDIYIGIGISKKHIGYMKNDAIYLDQWIADKKAVVCRKGVISIEGWLSEDIIAWYDREFLYMMKNNYKQKVAIVRDGYIIDYVTNNRVGEYKGSAIGALAIPLFYDFENVTKEEEPAPVKEDRPLHEGIIADIGANIIVTLIFLVIGYVVLTYSFSTWGDAIHSGAANIKGFDFQSLDKHDRNDFICLMILFLGSFVLGLIYMNKNRYCEESLIDHCGNVYSWLRWLIIPIEFVNYAMTKDIAALFFIPFACMLVFIAPAIVFGAVTWFICKLFHKKNK